MSDKELLRIENLEIRYETDDGVVKALNDVSLYVNEGETLGLVGETGAGKTTLAKGILRLIQTPPGHIVGGKVFYDGKDVLSMTEQEMHQIRGNAISMVFQDPLSSLTPVFTVGTQIIEALTVHHPTMSRTAATSTSSLFCNEKCMILFSMALQFDQNIRSCQWLWVCAGMTLLAEASLTLYAPSVTTSSPGLTPDTISTLSPLLSPRVTSCFL